jgi:hypothetical protein
MYVSCDGCVLSGRGLCVGLIPCPEESYRVCVCNQAQQYPLALYTYNE